MQSAGHDEKTNMPELYFLKCYAEKPNLKSKVLQHLYLKIMKISICELQNILMLDWKVHVAKGMRSCSNDEEIK